MTLLIVPADCGRHPYPMQFTHTALRRKLCLKEELKKLSQHNFYPNPHRVAHDLQISFIFSHP